MLNVTLTIFFRELVGLVNLGDGALKFSGDDLYFFVITNPSTVILDKEVVNRFINREQRPIVEELGFDPSKPIRSQNPKPSLDRKALDDIVFDTLELTEKERKEVYWAVAELVQNRLQKAKSV